MFRSLSSRLSAIPSGAGVLFFVQMFSTLGFAVLYSSLVLYATDHLNFTPERAALIMGVFGAFNYGLHLFGGYLGGRFLSNRNLFVGGMLLQVLGCASIAGGTADLLYWGLALFLTGSGLNVTCLNMMLTQRFAPEDNRREAAFLWNYAGMNVGFFIGFTMAGHYQLSKSYTELFVFATLGNVLAIVLALSFWRVLVDINTPLLQASRRDFWQRFVAGIFILLGLVPLLWFLLQHPDGTESLVKLISAGVALSLIVLTVRHSNVPEKRRMWAYLILTLGSLMFWSLYQMAPSGLQLFAVGNVKLELAGVVIAPQWIQNINTVVIVLGGPLLAAWFTRLRTRGWPVDVPQQFAASLVLMGLGFLALPLGIALADGRGQVAFVWLFISYVLQSLGELLISPVGYAMIGRLAPRQYQGVMMGSWMLVTGLASLFAADFSGMVAQPVGSSALSSNPAYATLFTQLGLGSVAVGVLLVFLIPTLRRLIAEPDTSAAAAA
ncbi:peptide MFS transporter [Roseateles koreensis]|uniref:Oligopeptide:H+ symporter n=1 Tax=Roseateles koreensis TaxID=2987526 RepID=A0ABT5KU11_9BURK|nr:oligopeptide:H+ symporter [Roseateles koreensis]MDC8785920.1 oligopeptide:H+ symporter [Roseateles koreensis]